MQRDSALYDFVFRAQLAEEALDRVGRASRSSLDFDVGHLRTMLGIEVLDTEHVIRAEKMALVYTTVAAFENSVRDLIKSILLDAVGENWWDICVSEKIQKAATSRMDEEKKVRWHVQRGDDPIRFTMMPNLANIIQQNFQHFEDYLPTVEWVKNVFEVV